MRSRRSYLVFLFFLALSAVLWYITKLSYTYTTTIPVRVEIGSGEIKLHCVVEETGYSVFSHRYLRPVRITVGVDELVTAPSSQNADALQIDPFSLQNAISRRAGDLKIISVGTVPEIPLTTVR